MGRKRPWHGQLAALVIHDRALTAAEIKERFVAGPDAADEVGDAVAWYTFAESGSESLSDRSVGGVGPELVIPERQVAVPQDFIPTVLDLEQALRFAAAAPDGRVALDAAVRVLGHLVLFAVLAGLVVRAVPDRRRSLGVVALAAPVALASVITVVRFTAGRSSSVVDVAAAALGSSLAVVLPVVWRHLAVGRSEDSDGRGPAATR